MNDHERLEQLEERIERAGEPTDEPHHEMAEAVATATVEKGAVEQRMVLVQMRNLVTQQRWLAGLAVVVLALFVLALR